MESARALVSLGRDAWVKGSASSPKFHVSQGAAELAAEEEEQAEQDEEEEEEDEEETDADASEEDLEGEQHAMWQQWAEELVCALHPLRWPEIFPVAPPQPDLPPWPSSSESLWREPPRLLAERIDVLVSVLLGNLRVRARSLYDPSVSFSSLAVAARRAAVANQVMASPPAVAAAAHLRALACRAIAAGVPVPAAAAAFEEAPGESAASSAASPLTGAASFESTPPVLRALVQHLGLLCELMRLPPVLTLDDDAVPLPSSFTNTAGLIPQRCGILRLKLVELLASMVVLRDAEVDAAIAQSGFIAAAADLFFALPFNSGLHNAFALLVTKVLASPSLALKQQLLVENRLPERLLAAIADNNAHQASGQPRRGFMGSVFSLCNQLVAATKSDDCVRAAVAFDAWAAFCAGPCLSEYNELSSRVIGGPAPVRPSLFFAPPTDALAAANALTFLSSSTGRGGAGALSDWSELHAFVSALGHAEADEDWGLEDEEGEGGRDDGGVEGEEDFEDEEEEL